MAPFHLAYCCPLAPAAADAFAASEPDRSHALPARCESAPEATYFGGPRKEERKREFLKAQSVLIITRVVSQAKKEGSY